MENPEEILHSLEEFAKMKPKDIPRELEEYLMFVAKTGDPIYQWSAIKSLFREKLVNVITEFYETCPVMEIPPCPNVDIFNYDLMKNFILEKLEAFSSAPFTLQRICELLTTPRKEYNRIDKFMRALEKNILVVSTVEPGGRRSNENGDGIMNGIETEPSVPEPGAEINIEEMDETPSWGQEIATNHVSFEASNTTAIPTTNQECIISCTIVGNQPYVSIEPLPVEALPKLNVETTKETESSEPLEDDVLDKAEPPKSVAEPDKPISECDKPISEPEKVICETEKIPEAVISEKITEPTVETKIPDIIEHSEVLKVSPETKEVTPETEDESKMIISEDAPLEVNKVEEKIKEAISSTPQIDTVVKDTVSDSSEQATVENISPETSTESPDTLETPKNDQEEKEITEKVEVEEVPMEKSEEMEEKVEKVENMPEKVEKIEVDIEQTEETEKIEVSSKKIEEFKKEEAITVETPKGVEKIEQKVVEEAKQPNQEQVDMKIDDHLQTTIKIDVETVATDVPKEIVAKVVEKLEVAEELKPDLEAVKDIENIELKTSEIEPMNVEETPEVGEIKADNQIDETSETKIEIDPLQLDDITKDTPKPTEELKTEIEIKKPSDDMAVTPEETKTETPKVEEKVEDTEEIPMDVDMAEEVKVSVPNEEPKPEKPESIEETEEKKEPETDQNKSES